MGGEEFEGMVCMHATREAVYFITKAANTTDTYTHML